MALLAQQAKPAKPAKSRAVWAHGSRGGSLELLDSGEPAGGAESLGVKHGTIAGSRWNNAQEGARL
jgi:hypothetical protein